MIFVIVLREIALTQTCLFSSPFSVHHRELPERPLRERQREQRHLLLVLRLLEPGRVGIGIVRIGIRSLLPLYVIPTN